tara:strand:- start:57 stop:179 length:123 start_codon:yes stop_codon:yes gene_type:complete
MYPKWSPSISKILFYNLLKVLIIAGVDSKGMLASVEIYEP